MIPRTTHHSPPTTHPQPRRGIVLLAVLMVLVLLTLAAYQYAALMTAEYMAMDSYRRSAQARAFAESGVHYTAALLADPGNVANPYDDAGAFSGIVVQQGDSPRLQGRFSVVAPLGPDDSPTTGQPFHYGATDEGGKINLNALLALDSSGQIAYNMLIQLPNMTPDVANAILDWIDPDDNPRANGAENSHYSTLPSPYLCKNGPLDSLDELLLVRGVTPQLLYGNDRNRNGVLDGDEDDGSGLLTGWAAYLTIYSREQNLNSQGQPRIYVNDQDLNALYEKLNAALGQDLALYIRAYRTYGPSSTGTGGSTGGSGSSGASGKGSSGKGSGTGSSGTPRPASQMSRTMINTQGTPPRSISSLYELINSQVSIPNTDPKQPAILYASPLNDPGAQRTLLPLLLDQVTTVKDAQIQGRINVNTAPRAVLTALPGLSDTDVQTIMARRPVSGSGDPSDPIFQTPAWLLTEASLKPATLQALEKYVTARSQVYRVQVVGYFDGGGPTARIEAVIDTNNGRPRIVYWRDLTELGKGFDMGNTGDMNK